MFTGLRTTANRINKQVSSLSNYVPNDPGNRSFARRVLISIVKKLFHCSLSERTRKTSITGYRKYTKYRK